jgi:hypothetical protein
MRTLSFEDVDSQAINMFKLLHSTRFILPPPDLTSKFLAYYHTTLHSLPEGEWLKKELGLF